MRVVIVDDEPLARQRLARLCGEHPDIEVVGEAGTGKAAVTAVRSHRPNLLLLDIELPDMNGFQVLNVLAAERLTLPTIIVTAHPDRALEAFDSSALDYLVKPVDARRFDASINRARRRESKALLLSTWEQIATEARAKLGSHRGASAPARRQLVGERARRLHFVDAQTVDYLEAEGNYVTIHVQQERYICRNTLKHLAATLAPLGFVRIQKSLLMNFGQVVFAERLGHGAFAFTLRGGARLISGARFRTGILQHLRNGQHSEAAPTDALPEPRIADA